jgi:excisionase family DNA binding protein
MSNSHLLPIPLSEAARLMAVSPRTVRRLVDRGDLRAFRIGATLALPPEALPEPLQRSLERGRDEPLLTLHDAAARLGFPPIRVRELTALGILSASVVGRSQRWSPLEIEALVPAAGAESSTQDPISG